MKTIDQRELQPTLEKRLKELFSRVNGIEVYGEKNVPQGKIDFEWNVSYFGRAFKILVEVKSNGNPRVLRQTTTQLKTYMKSIDDSSKTYPIVAAPYISETGMDLCKEEGVGCFDLAGNCFISFGSIYIESRGFKNAEPSTRSIKSIFSPKSSRISRVLLSDVKKWWKIQELAKEARVSIGLASRIKNRLLEEELAVEDGKSVKVKSPKSLLTAWVENYSYRKNKVQEYYTLNDPRISETTIQVYCKEQNIDCALGLFSGASRVAPHVRFNKIFMYVDGDLDKTARENDLKPVSSGANVVFLRPYDKAIFMNCKEIDGLKVVSNIQLYLDLKTYKGRGEEAADFLLKMKMELEWQ